MQQRVNDARHPVPGVFFLSELTPARRRDRVDITDTIRTSNAITDEKQPALWRNLSARAAEMLEAV